MDEYTIKLHYRYNGESKHKEFTVPLAALQTKRIKVLVESLALVVELQNCIWDVENNKYISNIGDISEEEAEGTDGELIQVGV